MNEVEWMRMEESANEGACYAAAELEGIPPEDADECEDGTFSCAQCPWRATARNWKPEPV
jgi:hypothetical protein